MAQADTEQRNFSCKVVDHVERDARVVRSPWSRRDDDAVGTQTRFNLVDGNVIVSTHGDLLTEFTQILNQVVSKRVVVVDYEEHCLRSLVFGLWSLYLF